MKRFFQLIHFLSKRRTTPLPPGAFQHHSQISLFNTMISSYPLNTYIINKIPFIGKLRFAIASVIASLFPVLLIMFLALIVEIEITRSDLSYMFFLFSFSMLGFICVNIGHERLLENSENIVNIMGNPENCDVLSEVFVVGFNLANQLLFGAIFIVISIFFLHGTNGAFATLKSAYFTLWWMWSFGILIGNGLYWAVISPYLIYIVTTMDNLIYDKLAPVETPGIRNMSSMLANYSIMNGITLTVVILCFMKSDFPSSDMVQARAIIYLFILGGLGMIYSAFYPQLLLARLVSKLKVLVEKNLVSEQNKLLQQGATSHDALLYTLKLLDRLRSSKNTPLAGHVILKYIASLVVPLAAFFIKKGDISIVLQKLGF